MTFLYWTGHRVFGFSGVHEPPFMTSGKRRHREYDEFMLIQICPKDQVCHGQVQESFPTERLLPNTPWESQGSDARHTLCYSASHCRNKALEVVALKEKRFILAQSFRGLCSESDGSLLWGLWWGVSFACEWWRGQDEMWQDSQHSFQPSSQ